MPPGLIFIMFIMSNPECHYNVGCRIELRPEAIGADKDFKDLRVFKVFSDGGPARGVEVFYGGV